MHIARSAPAQPLRVCETVFRRALAHWAPQDPQSSSRTVPFEPGWNLPDDLPLVKHALPSEVSGAQIVQSITRGIE